MKYLEDILKFMKANRFHIIGLECYVKYSEFCDESMLIKLMSQYPRLMKLLLHSSHKNKVINSTVNDQAYLAYTTQLIDSATHCGVIHKDYFTVNLSAFAESLNYNSCLNRKISVDVDGNIKNCPSMIESYGNIDTTTLLEILNTTGIDKYWNFSKETIEVCKDCEFRHICTDCRAYVEIPKDKKSKPLKCGYDPYTNKWSKWSKNPLKTKAIQYYNLSKNTL